MASQPDAPNTILDTVEGKRLFTAQAPAWRRLGPYVSDRQWGTVRETARAARRGTICRMITLLAARIGAARRRSADTATAGSAGVWAWRYGISAIQSRRSCSVVNAHIPPLTF